MQIVIPKVTQVDMGRLTKCAKTLAHSLTAAGVNMNHSEVKLEMNLQYKGLPLM
jgi:hypothetical protein